MMQVFRSMADRVAAKFRRKPRTGLRSPRRTKQVMRWAIGRNSRWLYAAPVCWPHALGVAATVYAVFFVQPPPNVAAWLHTTKTVLAALVAMIMLAEAMRRPLRSWRRRHAATRIGHSPAARTAPGRGDQ